MLRISAVFVDGDLWGSMWISSPTLWGYFELWGSVVGNRAENNLEPLSGAIQS